MSAHTYQDEVDRYLVATSKSPLRTKDLAKSLWGFKREVLQLAHHAWPPEAEVWFKRAEALASPQEIDSLLQEISRYRTEVLHEPLLADGEHSGAASLTFLFGLMFYIPVSGELTQSAYASLGFFIDEFSIEFITHFGQADALLEALRRNFTLTEA